LQLTGSSSSTSTQVCFYNTALRFPGFHNLKV